LQQQIHLVHDISEFYGVLFIGRFGAQLQYAFSDFVLHTTTGSAPAIFKSPRGPSQASGPVF
jgi:hypothetical protein